MWTSGHAISFEMGVGSKMPKMKSHRGAMKRFKRTGSGKIVHWRNNRSHLNEHKSRKRLRRLRHKAVLGKTQAKRILRAAPYLK